MSQIRSPSSNAKKTQQGSESQKRYLEHESQEDEEDAEVSAAGNEAIAGIMTQSQWKIKLDSKSLRVDFSKVCSICLSETESDDKQLIRPCLCSGYRSYQHKSCIEEWIEQTGVVSCPFCNVIYDFTKTKKSFFCYIRECELHHSFMTNVCVFLFALYIFMVGLAICYNFIFAIYECDSRALEDGNLRRAILQQTISWQDLEKLVDCHRSISQFEQAHSWPSIVLFGLTVVGTILLFTGIISICFNTIFRYYIKYQVWSKKNFRACVRAYPSQLPTGTVVNGLQVSDSSESREAKREVNNGGSSAYT